MATPIKMETDFRAESVLELRREDFFRGYRRYKVSPYTTEVPA